MSATEKRPQPNGQSAAMPSPFQPIADYAFLSNCHTGALVAPTAPLTGSACPASTRPASSAPCWTARPAPSVWGVQLVGMDYLSIAPKSDPAPTHVTLLSAGAVILEGADLREVEPGWYRLLCLFLLLVGSDGAPARTILMNE